MTSSPTPLKIFLSHSSQDKASCDTVVGALRVAGADVWYDEHNLGAGQLLEEIQRELQARPVFVVLLSKNAFASQWVRREATWAFNLATREPNRLILPITVGVIEARVRLQWTVALSRGLQAYRGAWNAAASTRGDDHPGAAAAHFDL